MAPRSRFLGRSLGHLLGPSLAIAAFACSSSAKPPAQPAPPAPEAPAPTAPAPAPTASADQAFDAFAQRFLDEYLKRLPTNATNAGDHRFDANWPDVSVQGEAAFLKWVEDTRAALAALPRQGLSEQNAIDAQILDEQLRGMAFELAELKPFENNASSYSNLIGEGIDPLVSREFASKAERMNSLRGRLEGVPAIVAAAKARLGKPPKIETEQAIQQVKGLIGLVDAELPKMFADQGAQKDALAAAAKTAGAALRELQTFLEKEVLPRSDGSFRIGRDKFTKKLAFALGDNVDIDTIAKEARALLAQTQGEMVDTAKQIWTEDKLGALPKLDTVEQRKAFVKKVLDHVAKDKPTNKTIVAHATTWLEKATQFTREQNLVRVPDEPVKVIEMPEYRRGFSVAYCDSSGPLEAKPETFYAISPTPSDWPKARVDSFYREYNESMLAELSIHEAMPGHYLQLMHNNQFKSKIRAVFGSGPFIEGWAVYSEWFMAQHGFGGARVKLQREKMVLRLAANAILDHDIHAGDMDEKAALALMKNEAFQEDGEAVGKWKRARLSSAQLTTYYYGFTEHLKLRKDVEKTPGFTERAYHDKLLSFGSPSMKIIRQLMTKK